MSDGHDVHGEEDYDLEGGDEFDDVDDVCEVGEVEDDEDFDELRELDDELDDGETLDTVGERNEDDDRGGAHVAVTSSLSESSSEINLNGSGLVQNVMVGQNQSRLLSRPSSLHAVASDALLFQDAHSASLLNTKSVHSSVATTVSVVTSYADHIQPAQSRPVTSQPAIPAQLALSAEHVPHGSPSLATRFVVSKPDLQSSTPCAERLTPQPGASTAGNVGATKSSCPTPSGQIPSRQSAQQSLETAASELSTRHSSKKLFHTNPHGFVDSSR